MAAGPVHRAGYSTSHPVLKTARMRHWYSESSYTDAILRDVSLDIGNLVLCCGDHKGLPALRETIAAEAAGLESIRADIGKKFALSGSG